MILNIELDEETGKRFKAYAKKNGRSARKQGAKVIRDVLDMEEPVQSKKKQEVSA